MALERAYLNHKPRNRIRVLLTRQYAERISDDLHRRAYYNRAKVPGTMAQEQEKMSRECNGKQHDAEDADGKRRRVSNYIVNIMSSTSRSHKSIPIDNNRSTRLSHRIWEVRINISLHDPRFCHGECWGCSLSSIRGECIRMQLKHTCLCELNKRTNYFALPIQEP